MRKQQEIFHLLFDFRVLVYEDQIPGNVAHVLNGVLLIFQTLRSDEPRHGEVSETPFPSGKFFIDLRHTLKGIARLIFPPVSVDQKRARLVGRSAVEKFRLRHEMRLCGFERPVAVQSALGDLFGDEEHRLFALLLFQLVPVGGIDRAEIGIDAVERVIQRIVVQAFIVENDRFQPPVSHPGMHARKRKRLEALSFHFVQQKLHIFPSAGKAVVIGVGLSVRPVKIVLRAGNPVDPGIALQIVQVLVFKEVDVVPEPEYRAEPGQRHEFRLFRRSDVEHFIAVLVYLHFVGKRFYSVSLSDIFAVFVVRLYIRKVGQIHDIIFVLRKIVGAVYINDVFRGGTHIIDPVRKLCVFLYGNDLDLGVVRFIRRFQVIQKFRTDAVIADGDVDLRLCRVDIIDGQRRFAGAEPQQESDSKEHAQ